MADNAQAAGSAAAGAAAGGPTTAATAAAAGADGKGQGAQEPFYKAHNLDQDHVRYLEDKGVTELKQLVKSSMDFERAARDRNAIPAPDVSDAKKLADWEGWEKIGWVKDKAKYEVKKPELKAGQGFDETSYNDFVADAHELRLPAGAASELFNRQFTKFQERIGAAKRAQEDEAVKLKDALKVTLKSEWGENFEPYSEQARRTMTALGIGAADAGELEKLMDAPRMVKLFQKIGAVLPEDSLKTAKEPGGAAYSPAQAAAERRRLENDAAWMKIFNDQRHPDNKRHVEQRQKLIEIEAKAIGG